jgi:arginyl-tRNA synthetase
MRLENLIRDIDTEMEKKISDNRNVREEDAKGTAEIVGLSAIKYGDLSNQATKDYVFDVDKFTSFEGNTGPYILYTIVRIKSILAKYDGSEGGLLPAAGPEEKSLMLDLSEFGNTVEDAFRDLAPHRLCAYIYQTANDFNRFYHENKILTEENPEQKASWIRLLRITKAVMEKGIDILGFRAPDHM